MGSLKQRRLKFKRVSKLCARRKRRRRLQRGVSNGLRRYQSTKCQWPETSSSSTCYSKCRDSKIAHCPGPDLKQAHLRGRRRRIRKNRDSQRKLRRKSKYFLSYVHDQRRIQKSKQDKSRSVHSKRTTHPIPKSISSHFVRPQDQETEIVFDTDNSKKFFHFQNYRKRAQFLYDLLQLDKTDTSQLTEDADQPSSAESLFCNMCNVQFGKRKMFLKHLGDQSHTQQRDNLQKELQKWINLANGGSEDVDELEQHERRMDLLFHGIPESEDEVLVEKVLDVIKNKLELLLKRNALEKAYRLGPPERIWKMQRCEEQNYRKPTQLNLPQSDKTAICTSISRNSESLFCNLCNVQFSNRDTFLKHLGSQSHTQQPEHFQWGLQKWNLANGRAEDVDKLEKDETTRRTTQAFPQLVRKMRPIIVHLNSYRDRQRIVNRLWKLKGTEVMVTEYLTPFNMSLLQAARKSPQSEPCWTMDRNQEDLNELERHDRRLDLLFYGIPETEDEVCNEKVIDVINNLLRIRLNRHALEESYRRGHGKTRPIIVRFQNSRDRQCILNSKRKLQGTGIFISEHLTRFNLGLLQAARNSPQLGPCWTEDGNVYVRYEGRPRHIKTMADIQALSVTRT